MRTSWRSLREIFRSCFFVPESLSIEEVLEKAKNPTKDQACYNKMREVRKKYKDQSLDKKSLLREDLKAKDVVNCKDVERAKTQANLNRFALNVCSEAKIQKQEQEEEERLRKERELEQARLEEERTG